MWTTARKKAFGSHRSGKPNALLAPPERWVKPFSGSSRKLPAEAFYEWGDAARAKKKECDEGAITLDEFKAWLERS